MVVVTDYRKIAAEEWDRLLSESPVATWFQSREAYEFFLSLPDLMTPFFVAVLREPTSPQAHPKLKPCVHTDLATVPTSHTSQISSTLVGLVVGYVTKEKNKLKQYFTRRAIIYGGPLLAEDITDEELTELLSTLNSQLSKKSIFVETRNFNDYSRWCSVFCHCGFQYQPHYDMHISCSDSQQMWASVSESKQRQIRKSMADGVEIVEAATEADIHGFYLLLRELYRTKVRTPLFAESFFQTFVRQGRGVLLLLRQNGQLLGGMLCPVFEGKVLYEWYVVGPAVVTWAAMDYANRHGLPLFDLMGAGAPDVPYGVRDFKLQFGGELKEYGRFLCVNQPLLYQLGSVVVKLMRAV